MSALANPINALAASLSPATVSAAAIIHFEDELVIPATAFTFHGFRAWANSPEFPQRGRICFIQGSIEVDMNADELRHHNPVKSAVLTDLTNLIRAERLGKILAEGVRLVNEEGDVISEPDLVFASQESIKSGRVRYVASVDESDRLVEMEGTPDLVLEVVSKHSVQKDTVVLPKAYFEGGIPEYWLIEATEKMVDFQLLIRGEQEYVKSAKDSDGYLFSPILKRSFLLDRTLDELGHYDYQLLWR
ncbi:MAG: Uma2 family endonuclease [Planctomycetales bacterium]|nr:Uma2 family endonuclease [Planctomycetales bacterium]